MKSKILVIDDEEAIRFTIQKFLSREGYEVSTAKNYYEALEELSKTDFDLIYADIILGAKTGIDVLKEVKKRTPTCPVVLITGCPSIETTTEAVRQGAYDYIPKPVKKDNLLRITRMALQHKAVIEEKIKYQSNLEAIFRSVKDAIITVDNGLRIIEVNESSREICGFSHKDVEGKPVNSLLKGCNGKCLESLKDTINKKQPVEMLRFVCNREERPEQVVNITTYPLLDHLKKINGCVMVVKDETRLADLEHDLQNRQQFHKIVGRSDKMQKIYSLIDVLSDIQTTVLITGESGTGKELVAEALHYHKGNIDKPLVKVNCTALSDNLLESELFGHIRGAFTGAISNKTGRFEKADGGTIFLDEIGDISDKMQLRLLRILQEKEFECVGDSTPVKVDVRIVAATNQDLREKVRLGSFREDLYHRLKVVELFLPPLRDRREDIPFLIDHFLKTFNKKFRKSITAVSEDVQELFMNYRWPGNVRELYNTLEYASILCRQPIITINDLSPDFEDTNVDTAYSSEKKRVNAHQTIIQALKKTDWNKAKAARLLGIDRKTIYLKIKRYNIVKE